MSKILLVDDDGSFRKLLELRLKSIVGPTAQCVHCASLSETEQVIGNEAWDLIILDQHLQDGRGVDFLTRNPIPDLNVLVLSSDAAPEVPGEAMKAGAAFFLSKQQVSEPLFRPLILGLIERNRLTRELSAMKKREIEEDTIRTLVATLRHEINNPLGVVLGAAFLVQQAGSLNEQQRKAAEMIEGSGQRIRDVVSKLAAVTAAEQTIKSGVAVFQVPGDPSWKK